MKTSISISIQAEYGRVFGLGARVEDWGRILPHYRYVRVLKRDGNRKWVRMSAWRDFVPVTWTAIETVIEGSPQKPGRILFHHIGGMVKGMEVEWSFKVRRDEVVVTISHDLANPPFPVKLLGPRLIELIVGKGFINYIAGKTLRRVKELAEGVARVPGE